jgi:hypothetical protein
VINYSNLKQRINQLCLENKLKCTFCYGNPYSHERFELRSIAEIKADIDSVKAIGSELKELSWKLGYAGKIEPLANILGSSDFTARIEVPAGDELSNFYCLVNVFNWLVSGSKTAFFQDADSQIVGETVREDVAFGPENLRLSPEEITQRVNWALCVMGLEKLSEKPCYLLSGGEKRRLAIAGCYLRISSFA